MDKQKLYKRNAEWDKKNTVMTSVKLVRSTDADILQFLEGKQKQTVIKAALREYMKNHKEETNDAIPSD